MDIFDLTEDCGGNKSRRSFQKNRISMHGLEYSKKTLHRDMWHKWKSLEITEGEFRGGKSEHL